MSKNLLLALIMPLSRILKRSMRFRNNMVTFEGKGEEHAARRLLSISLITFCADRCSEKVDERSVIFLPNSVGSGPRTKYSSKERCDS